MNYELKQYSFGETIGKGFNLYFNNFISIIFISLICHAVEIYLTRYLNFIHPSRPFSGIQYFLNIGVTSFFNTTFEFILSAWIVHLVSKKFLESSSIATDNKKTSILPIILPIFGLSLMSGVAVALGMMALIFPGIIVKLGLSVVTAVLVVEGMGIRKSMRRSWDLTQGHKGTIFGISFVVGLILGGISIPFFVATRFLNLNVLQTTYLLQAVTAFTAPIQSCVMVVVYFNLRIEKEAFNIEYLTGQFSLTEDQEFTLEG